MPQLPENETTDSREEFFLSKMDNEQRLEKCMFKLKDRYRQVNYCRKFLPKKHLSKSFEKGTENDRIRNASFEISFFELRWRFFQGKPCTGWNNSSYLKQTSSSMGVLILFLMSLSQ